MTIEEDYEIRHTAEKLKPDSDFIVLHKYGSSLFSFLFIKSPMVTKTIIKVW